jgi:hypothetical protein
MVKKYRNKPLEIEAIIWTGKNMYQVLNFTECSDSLGFRGNICQVDTPHGTFECEIGDYIIKNTTGGVYPCKPNVFAMKYEEV